MTTNKSLWLVGVFSFHPMMTLASTTNESSWLVGGFFSLTQWQPRPQRPPLPLQPPMCLHDTSVCFPLLPNDVPYLTQPWHWPLWPPTSLHDSLMCFLSLPNNNPCLHHQQVFVIHWWVFFPHPNDDAGPCNHQWVISLVCFLPLPTNYTGLCDHQRVFMTRWCVFFPHPNNDTGLCDHQRVFMTRWCVFLPYPTMTLASATTNSVFSSLTQMTTLTSLTQTQSYYYLNNLNINIYDFISRWEGDFYAILYNPIYYFYM